MRIWNHIHKFYHNTCTLLQQPWLQTYWHEYRYKVHNSGYSLLGLWWISDIFQKIFLSTSEECKCTTPLTSKWNICPFCRWSTVHCLFNLLTAKNNGLLVVISHASKWHCLLCNLSNHYHIKQSGTECVIEVIYCSLHVESKGLQDSS
jgi:hypothetical protein